MYPSDEPILPGDEAGSRFGVQSNGVRSIGRVAQTTDLAMELLVFGHDHDGDSPTTERALRLLC